MEQSESGWKNSSAKEERGKNVVHDENDQKKIRNNKDTKNSKPKSEL